ncbi:Histone deacetylase HDT1 [Sesamum angolense]|uniref:Histone deacetylase HDT1 n=1 Tax=Sesamum angolense TaxID=2727404 RepID=A0AAE1WFG5_9LAMI|nr:Histone deacetylase HDT1 [Sesamum angolense]
MEFWGVEVKSGEPLKVLPGDGMVLHLSQACLGELKKEKGTESVCLFVNVDGKKLVLGTLFTEKLPQQQFDLVFDQDFELSHNWKSGSVYFFGYKAANPFEEEYPLIWLHIF